MLSREENDIVTKTGIGNASWSSHEKVLDTGASLLGIALLDCPPVRLKLLGNDWSPFATPAGVSGIIDEFCPHRRASLFLGRNEELVPPRDDGCKFDVEGNSYMPNEPAESNFKHKIRSIVYPAVEIGGVVWAYMGPPDKVPPWPKFAWTQVPETHRHVSKIWQECNWLQALEGGLDTAHTAFLHRRLTAKGNGLGVSPQSFKVKGMAPKLEVDLTDYGYLYASIRSLGQEGSYARVYHYVMPFHQLRAFQLGSGGSGEKRDLIKGHMWVPMDDENCMVYNWTYNCGEEPLKEEDRLEPRSGTVPGCGRYKWFSEKAP